MDTRLEEKRSKTWASRAIRASGLVNLECFQKMAGHLDINAGDKLELLFCIHWGKFPHVFETEFQYCLES